MKRFFRKLWRSRAGSFGFVVVVAFVAVALAAPLVAPDDPVKTNLRQRLAPPMTRVQEQAPSLLGRDQLGRDILSRIIYGSRVTLIVAATSVILGGVVGIALGLVAGFYGGWVERILMRLVDVQLSLPMMLLALIIVAVLGPSLQNLVIVLALTSWTRYARIVRGEVLSLREREFVLSAVAAGAKATRIIVHHILPNVLSAAVVVGTLELARVIIMESALSFLGLGVQPPAPSWGRMLADGRSYMASAWWLATFPGLAIVILVLGVNMLGDWLRDHFDPRLSGVK
jgi:peptide/nickel transport system permease protein